MKTIRKKLMSFGLTGSMLLIIMMSFSGCNKFLDVKPAGELPADQLLNDENGFESAMYGVYASMTKSSLYGQNLSYNMLEILAQYFTSFGNEHVQNLQEYDYKHGTVEAELLRIWSDMYNNIANVNNILKNLENYTTSDFEYYNLYRGEALGLRAFMHFDLLRIYTENIQRNQSATGIPYSMDFSLSPSDFESAAKVYDLIIADLKEAEQLLAADQSYFTNPKVIWEDTYLRDRETHFNLYAAQALLARVYFTKGDLPNALNYAEKVINSGKFNLMDRSQVGNGYMRGVLSPEETIFGLYSRNLFNAARERFLLQTTFFSYNLRGDLRNTYESGQVGHDYRWDGYMQLPQSTGGAIRFVKMVDPYQVSGLEFQRPSELLVGINMIRLPEMYYIAAEALLETNPTQARDYFDLVIESRGLVGLADRDPAQSLNVGHITTDRYKEFIGEGQTFFNMKRLHLDIVDVNMTVVPANNDVYVLPIPIEENDYRN